MGVVELYGAGEAREDDVRVGRRARRLVGLGRWEGSFDILGGGGARRAGAVDRWWVGNLKLS